MEHTKLGTTVMTQGVYDLVQGDASRLNHLFTRFINCDWGDLDEEDCSQNNQALLTGNDRIFAKYQLFGRDVYIITEHDRSATTVLFPSEY